MPVKGSLFDPALRHGISLRLLSTFLSIRYANLHPVSRVDPFDPLDEYALALSSL